MDIESWEERKRDKSLPWVVKLAKIELLPVKPQGESAIGIHMSPPSSHPIPHLWVVIEHWCELPESYSKSPLAIYFTYGDMYVSMLLSHFAPPSPSLPVSTSLLCLRLHCCPANRFSSTSF